MLAWSIFFRPVDSEPSETGGWKTLPQQLTGGGFWREQEVDSIPIITHVVRPVTALGADAPWMAVVIFRVSEFKEYRPAVEINGGVIHVTSSKAGREPIVCASREPGAWLIDLVNNRGLFLPAKLDWKDLDNGRLGEIEKLAREGWKTFTAEGGK